VVTFADEVGAAASPVSAVADAMVAFGAGGDVGPPGPSAERVSCAVVILAVPVRRPFSGPLALAFEAAGGVDVVVARASGPVEVGAAGAPDVFGSVLDADVAGLNNCEAASSAGLTTSLVRDEIVLPTREPTAFGLVAAEGTCGEASSGEAVAERSGDESTNFPPRPRRAATAPYWSAALFGLAAGGSAGFAGTVSPPTRFAPGSASPAGPPAPI
jgi:hypothetical protein